MKLRGFEIVENHKKSEGVTLLPLRGTKTSAGYDFYTPVDLEIKPQEKVFFWTDVKAYMQDGEVLLLDIRSSLGIKSDLMLANTVPVIDSDYHNNPSNEGNIGISIRNLKPKMEFLGYETYRIEGHKDLTVPLVKDLTEENTVYIKAGDRVAQGIFVQYLESDNCNTDKDRVGGIGSTTETN